MGASSLTDSQKAIATALFFEPGRIAAINRPLRRTLMQQNILQHGATGSNNSSKVLMEAD